MAKVSMKVKQQRPAKFSTREYNRCRICGRPHAYLRKYGKENPSPTFKEALKYLQEGKI